MGKYKYRFSLSTEIKVLELMNMISFIPSQLFVTVTSAIILLLTLATFHTTQEVLLSYNFQNLDTGVSTPSSDHSGLLHRY